MKQSAPLDPLHRVIARILRGIQLDLAASRVPTLVISDHPNELTIKDVPLSPRDAGGKVERLRRILPRACLPWSISWNTPTICETTFAGVTYENISEDDLAMRLDDFMFIDRLFKRKPTDTSRAFAFGYAGQMGPDERFSSLWAASPAEAGIKLLLSLRPGLASDPERTLAADPGVAGPMRMRIVDGWLELDLPSVLEEARRIVRGGQIQTPSG